MSDETKNKCEEAGLVHAWQSKDHMYGFSMVHREECANCGLGRTKCAESKEWWSYSDGRPDELIYNMRPV